MSRDKVTQFVAEPDVDAKRRRMKKKVVMSGRSNSKEVGNRTRSCRPG